MNQGTQTLLRMGSLGRTFRSSMQYCVCCQLRNAGNLHISRQTSTSTSRTICYKSMSSCLKRTHNITLQQPTRHFQKVTDNLASFLGTSKATDWSKAVTEAEKIVGYPTSFMSLRCLLSDEFSNVAMHMRKLVGTKHPLLKTARRFIYDGTDSLQMRGLLVLLVAKAAGPSSTPSKDVLETMVSGIYPSQRSLAEITEMIHTAYLIHAGVVDLAPLQPADGGLFQDMQFGNKLAVLSGDFLLANASTGLARLYNTDVVELVSSAIRDMMAAEFVTNQFTESKPEGSAVTVWEKRTFLSTGSLMAKSCKAVMMLANHNAEWQEAGYHLGQNMGCAYQLHEDLRAVVSPESESPAVRMSSLPVGLHLEERPEDTTLLQGLVNDPSEKSHKQILKLLTSSGSISHSEQLIQDYQDGALQAASILGQSDAQTAITNMVRAVTEV